MNYYEAREIKKPDSEEGSGIFHFTCMNDGRVWGVGYCKERKCQHTTKEEASDCYRTYCKEQNNSKIPGGFPMDERWGQELIFFGSY